VREIHHWLVVFFAWPDGSIWSNILAWVLCGALAFGWTHRVLKRHHRRAHGEARRDPRERRVTELREAEGEENARRQR